MDERLPLPTNPPPNQVKLYLQRLKEFVVKFSPRREG